MPAILLVVAPHICVGLCLTQLLTCGARRWGNTNLNVLAMQKKVQGMDLPAFPLEVKRPSSAAELDAQEAYFSENSAQILADLEKHGAVVMRGFDLMKTPEGFERMWKALGMEACLDPLHSVAGRPVVSGKSAVYEAVNKPSRSKFYVGMHNEMVGKRTVRRAAFVCFKAAEVGGEFIITDGMRMLRDIKGDVLQASHTHTHTHTHTNTHTHKHTHTCVCIYT